MNCVVADCCIHCEQNKAEFPGKELLICAMQTSPVAEGETLDAVIDVSPQTEEMRATGLPEQAV